MSKELPNPNSKALQLKHIFGIRTDINNCLHYLEENVVGYVAGHHVVFHQLEDRSQTFVTGQSHGSQLPLEGITAIDIFHPKRC